MRAISRKLASWTLPLVLTTAWPASLVGDDSSVQDGVYSRAQASRGRKEFQQSCQTCHESKDFGGNYMEAWDGGTAYDLYELLVSTMPEEDPGVGGPEVFTDIVAYLFSLSDFPTGEEELASDEESLKTILIKGPYGGSDDR